MYLEWTAVRVATTVGARYKHRGQMTTYLGHLTGPTRANHLRARLHFPGKHFAWKGSWG